MAAIVSAGVLFVDAADDVLLVRTTYRTNSEIPGGSSGRPGARHRRGPGPWPVCLSHGR